jgi:hypothetical protein
MRTVSRIAGILIVGVALFGPVRTAFGCAHCRRGNLCCTTSAAAPVYSAPVASAPVSLYSAPVASAPVSLYSAPVASAPVSYYSTTPASAPVSYYSAPVMLTPVVPTANNQNSPQANDREQLTPGSIGDILNVISRITGSLGGGSSSGRPGGTFPNRIDIYVHGDTGTRSGTGSRSSSRSATRNRSSRSGSRQTARDVDDDSEDATSEAMSPGSDDLEDRVANLEDRLDQMHRDLNQGMSDLRTAIISSRRTGGPR